jgi:serine/threonine protein kinase
VRAKGRSARLNKKVFKAEHILEKVVYAVKMVLLTSTTHDQNSSEFLKIIHEIRHLAHFNHKNIVKYFTCWFEDATLPYIKTLNEANIEGNDFTIENGSSNELSHCSVGKLIPQTAMFIQMEFCEGGSMSEWLLSKGNHLKNYEAFNIFEDLLNGLIEIHSANIIHRDLK